MNTIESHIPVLEKLFQLYPIKTVLEFGMGFGSTPFFLNKGVRLISVEMQNKEWYDKVIDRHPASRTFEPILSIGPMAYKTIQLDGWYDLIFIDGHGDSRWSVINDVFPHTDLIAVHDTQEDSYGWNKVKMPEGWSWFDVKEFPVWTAILTNKKS